MEPAQIYEYLKAVKDPEVPAINVVELGVVRDVKCADDGVEIDITPTYTGCPAMKIMEADIRAELTERGIENITIRTVMFPPWTTDDMSDSTRAKLKAVGIAPPEKVRSEDLDPLNFQEKKVPCPMCDSGNTRLTSQFGSTACKALYYCDACLQPFEHFKCI